ncbi:MAG: hypothetical protein CMO81_12375 [Waddliaceae bacterium]|nr:hypothetical protein [Waddliaceae bacterium]
MIEASHPALLLVLVFCPFLQAAIFFSCKFLPRKSLGFLSTFFSLIYFAIVIYLTIERSEESPFYFSVPWVPSLLVNFSFQADGLSLFFALLITGMGSLVSFYAQFYMNYEDKRVRRFYSYIGLFMGSMLGAVTADNFLVLFVFWELTGVASYLLISYDYHLPSARISARSAFLINAVAALALLIGIILVGLLSETLELSEILDRDTISNKDSVWVFAIMALLLTGIAGKSAQFPFHFWLPEAMSAPTPVSAYLHSATMVKLGIYLLARIYPLFVETPLWFPLVTTLSMLTVLIGGVAALFAKKLKRILAFATISQLGFFISFYGIGDPQGLEYDYVHIFNHALYKGSLFMLVGILAVTAGITELEPARGICRRFPLLGVIFAVSIAAMAGLPGTTGFLSKELLVRDLVLLLETEPTGVIVFGGLILGLLLKVAFSYRLFYNLFFCSPKKEAEIKKAPSIWILTPPFILSSCALILGIWPSGLEQFAKAYVIEGLHDPNPEEIHLWHGLSLNLLLSLCLFIGGVYLYKYTRGYEKSIHTITLSGLADSWSSYLEKLPYQAGSLTRIIHRPHVSWHLSILFLICSVVLIPPLLEAGIYFKAPPMFTKFDGLALSLGLSSFLLLILRAALDRFIALSLSGFLVTFYFVLRGAPDVAMTQMVVEVAMLFVIVLLFFKVPAQQASKSRVLRLPIAIIFGVVFAALPMLRGKVEGGVSLRNFFELNALAVAKGANVVNTILVDFRGLDTLGEVAVITAAVFGVCALFYSSRNLWLKPHDSLLPVSPFSSVMPALFLVGLIMAFNLLIRGHNAPGGGFAGGMVIGISLVLVTMGIQKSRLFILSKIHPLTLLSLGLLSSLAPAYLSLIFGGGIMVSYFNPSVSLFNTPLLFDFGIMLLVIGAVTAIILVLRTISLHGGKQ